MFEWFPKLWNSWKQLIVAWFSYTRNSWNIEVTPCAKTVEQFTSLRCSLWWNTGMPTKKRKAADRCLLRCSTRCVEQRAKLVDRLVRRALRGRSRRGSRLGIHWLIDVKRTASKTFGIIWASECYYSCRANESVFLTSAAYKCHTTIVCVLSSVLSGRARGGSAEEVEEFCSASQNPNTLVLNLRTNGTDLLSARIEKKRYQPSRDRRSSTFRRSNEHCSR